MDRKEFLRTGSLLTLAAVAAPDQAFANSLLNNTIDKLADTDGNFVQQPLPYAENYLEPYMDAETLHLHYTFHHGGATKAANEDVKRIQAAIDGGEMDTIDHWTKKLSHHLSSHILHSIFWTNLINKKTAPQGELLKRMERDFGSYDKLQTYLAATAKGVDGNGWGILGYQPYVDRLTVMQCENHEKLTQWGVIPLLVIDVWEHSYYLKYKNKRAEFVDAFFNIVNWDNAAERLDAALKLTRG